MSRVRHVPASELPADVAETYERFAGGYGPFANQVAVFAHVPSAVTHVMGLLMELKSQKNVRWRYIELAIVTTSKLNACHYCVEHHIEPLRIEGIADATVERLPEFENNDGLDEVDRLVVEYTIAVTTSPQRIPDRLFASLKRHFSEAQIVELTMRIALCGFFNRFNDALQIDDELEIQFSDHAIHV